MVCGDDDGGAVVWNPFKAGASLPVLDDVAWGVLCGQLGIRQLLLDVDGQGLAIRRDNPCCLKVGADELIQLAAFGWVFGDDDAAGRVLGVSKRDGCNAVVWVGVLLHLDDAVFLRSWGRGTLSEVHGCGLADIGRKSCSKAVRVVGVNPRVMLRTRDRDVG